YARNHHKQSNANHSYLPNRSPRETRRIPSPTRRGIEYFACAVLTFGGVHAHRSDRLIAGLGIEATALAHPTCRAPILAQAFSPRHAARHPGCAKDDLRANGARAGRDARLSESRVAVLDGGIAASSDR